MDPDAVIGLDPWNCCYLKWTSNPFSTLLTRFAKLSSGAEACVLPCIGGTPLRFQTKQLSVRVRLATQRFCFRYLHEGVWTISAMSNFTAGVVFRIQPRLRDIAAKGLYSTELKRWVDMWLLLFQSGVECFRAQKIFTLFNRLAFHCGLVWNVRFVTPFTIITQCSANGFWTRLLTIYVITAILDCSKKCNG